MPSASFSSLRVILNRTEEEYRRGLPLPEIFPIFSTGVITGRDKLAMAFDRPTLVTRLRALRDGGEPGPGLDVPSWEAFCRDEHWPQRIRSFLLRPFDRR